MKGLVLIVGLFLGMISPAADNVLIRFKTPDGFVQERPTAGTFGEWLQTLSLKPVGTPTRTYSGGIARTDVYTAAVVDMSVGKQDLQQCADAVMRLRGEFLYHEKKYADISFKFVSGFKCDYVHYAEGYRYRNDKWVKTTKKTTAMQPL